MKLGLVAAVSAAMFGCGGGGGGQKSETQKVTIPSLHIIDPALENSTVKYYCGSDLVTTEYSNSTGYTENVTIECSGTVTIEAKGGIEVGTDNWFDGTLKADYTEGKSVVSPLTTLIAKGADIDKLTKILGVSKDKILHTDPVAENNINLVKAFNAVYTVIKENKTSELVTKINQYNPSSPATDLPSFNENVNVNIFY